MANWITDPKGAGEELVDGIISRIGEHIVNGISDLADVIGLGGSMIGCFLFMLSIKKGGDIAWWSIGIWLIVRIILF